MNTKITADALLNALWELARRAGVDTGFYQQWEVEHRASEIVVWPIPGLTKRIRFGRQIHDVSGLSPPFPVARAMWMHAPHQKFKRWVPDFIVPYTYTSKVAPLFTRTGLDEVSCSLDVLASVLLVLSRFEETFPGEVDRHGRFPAARSMAMQHGFCDRAIVDELGLAFEEALRNLLPNWRPRRQQFKVKISHDIDEVGIPFDVKTAAWQLVHYRDMKAALRDWVGRTVGARTSALECVLKIVKLSNEHGVKSAVYWKSSARSRFDTGYDPRQACIADVMRRIADEGAENGFHAGYGTFMSPDELAKEMSILLEVVGSRSIGGRQHFLRWSPHTWLHWERCGLKYDSTVGFPELVGFRAGTCYPYRPWLLELNRQCNLLEVPLLIMDRTLTAYMGLKQQQCFEVIADCITRCELVGGVFTLLWHNTSLLDPTFGNTYDRVLAKISGRPSFDCFAASTDTTTDVLPKFAAY